MLRPDEQYPSPSILYGVLTVHDHQQGLLRALHPCCQLKEGGKLIIPLGSTLLFQSLTLVTKIDGKPKTRHILDVRFVPMVGEMRKKNGK